MALDRTRIALRIEAHARRAAPDLVGPYAVLETTPRPGGGLHCRWSAMRLVPLGGDDAASKDVFVPVPAGGEAVLQGDEITAFVPAATSPEEVEEVRAYARSLLAAAAPGGRRRPGRPTHVVETDAAGRRVLRRARFS